MKKDFFTLISFILLASNIQIKDQEEQSIQEKAKESLSIFNNSLESLSIYIKEEKNKKACEKAIQVAKRLNEDIDNLKIVEPYYDWLEIKGVLLEFPKKYCPDLSTSNNQ